MGTHVAVGGGVVATAVLVGDDDGFVVSGFDVGSNDVGGAVVAVEGGRVEGFKVGNLVGVLVVEAHRQSPNREFHCHGSSDGQLQRHSAAVAQAPLQEPSYIELQLLP